MTTPFHRTMRSLNADRRSLAGIAIPVCLLTLTVWTLWLFSGALPVVEVGAGRITALDRPRPMTAPVDGHLTVFEVEPGARVAAGDLIAALDDSDLQAGVREEERLRDGFLKARQALTREAAARTESLAAARETAELRRVELAAQRDRTAAALTAARENAERIQVLYKRGEVAELTWIQADSARRELERELVSRKAALDQVAGQLRETEQAVRVELDRLDREAAALIGSVETADARIEQYQTQAERRRIRAPLDGVVAEVGDLRPGAAVFQEQVLAVMVPDGELVVEAYFSPAAALGRIQPGMRGQLRLDGFPWLQYGAVPVGVTRVSGEQREGRIRVELTMEEVPPGMTPVHGLPGKVYLELEHISPARLILRAAGKALEHGP